MKKKKLWDKLPKAMYELFLHIVGIFCLIMYWNAELIVDKMHYGIFLLVILILTLDNNHTNRNNMAAQ